MASRGDFMKVLSKLQAPAIAGVIREKTSKAAIAEIKNCMYDGADMIDLHMSCLENSDTDTLREIIQSSKLPILALNYNGRYDWSTAGFSEEERAESFLRAVDAGAAGINMQGYTFHVPSKDSFCGEDKYSFTKGNVEMTKSTTDIASNAYQDMKEKVDIKDVPTLSRYDEMMKDFYKSVIGEKANPYSYEHELAVQKTLCRVVGEN